MAAKIGLRPPRSLNPAEVESKKKTARSELKKMTTDADAEIAKFMARMAEKKAWSRIEEIKQEESVAGAAKADPTQFDPKSEYHDPKSTREEPRWLMRELRFVERFARVVTLEELKGCKALGAMAALQKGNRLSVTPVTKAEFDAVVRMAKEIPGVPGTHLL
jgi:predicted RNA-binding protein with PUA-like domain